MNSGPEPSAPPLEGRPSLRRALEAWAPLLLPALAVAFYANSLWVPFQFDDSHVIFNGEFVRRPFEQSWLRSRILLFLSFALNYRLGGLEPFGYHLINVALHAVSSVLVYLLARRLLGAVGAKPYPAALIAGALFAVHPFGTEAVTYVSSRSSLMCGTFYLLGAHAFLWARVGRKGAFRTAALVLPCFALSIATKEEGATLPLALLAIERVLPRAEEGRWRWLAFHLPLAAVSLAALGALIPFVSGYLRQERLPVGPYLLTESWVALRYLFLIVLPVGLNVDPEVPAVSLLSLRAAAGLTSLALTALLLLRAERAKVAAFGVGWFYAAIAASSSFIPLADFMAEHRAYFASAGVLIVFAHAAARLLAFAEQRFGSPKARVAFALLTLAWLGALGAGTFFRNCTWQGRVSLWADAVEKSPGKCRPRSSLGYSYLVEGDLERAEALLLQAASMPGKCNPQCVLGDLYLSRGQRERARDFYSACVRRTRATYSGYANLASFYLEEGDVDTAQMLLGKALTVPRPEPGGHASARRLLARIYRARGQLGRAEAELRAVLAQVESTEARLDLVELLSLLGRLEEAEAVAAKGDVGKLELERGRRLLDAGRLDEAARAWERALEVAPGSSEAANNLGSYHSERGDSARAEQYFRRAVDADPKNAAALFNLATTLEGQGRAEEARPLFARFVEVGAGQHPEQAAQVRARLGAPR